MSKTSEQEDRETAEEVQYFEAELASLKEELECEDLRPGEEILPKRREFIKLRIARLEKQIPEMREKAGKARVHAEWLAKINHPKRT